jgi:hypothetical protein
MADGDTYGFDQSSAQRIANATRQVERTLSPQRMQQQQVNPTPAFWIELGAESSGTPGVYSWTLVYSDPTATDGFTTPSSPPTGSAARESQGLTGLYDASKKKRYLAQFAGYDGSRSPWYTFTAGGVDPGTLQYQVFQMTAATTMGWDWVRAHA